MPLYWLTLSLIVFLMALLIMVDVYFFSLNYFNEIYVQRSHLSRWFYIFMTLGYFHINTYLGHISLSSFFFNFYCSSCNFSCIYQKSGFILMKSW